MKNQTTATTKTLALALAATVLMLLGSIFTIFPTMTVSAGYSYDDYDSYEEADEKEKDFEHEPRFEAIYDEELDYEYNEEDHTVSLEPYAYYWFNSASESIYLDYYVFEYDTHSYTIQGSVTIDKNKIIMVNGNNKQKVLTRDFAGTTNKIGFDLYGNLWFISTSNRLMMIEKDAFIDIKKNYPVYRYNYAGDVYLSKVESFLLNADNIIEAVVLPGRTIDIELLID